ncbi:S-phase kinase-associated protein 2-like [Portunus trituberculatus]|uniref:S-phase kinase-associated protein 2-like n=1 Tax=Portunus trituberculatus TaxID=210409 RepID=UPI001E1D0717|nr:S-phase kinase-associated protein 2-like [Portunus trituberculatus]
MRQDARGPAASRGRAETPQLTNVNKLGAHHTVWSHEGVVRGITAGMDLAAESGKCRYDKENANTSMKCARWSLGGDVGTNPPLLADMGLAVLQDEEASCHAPSSSPSPFSNLGHVTSASPSHKVLQHVNQNVRNQDFLTENSTSSTEFFVYKRRKLDNFSGDDKFNRMSDELILAVLRWLPKFMLARCAQVSRRWKRLAFDESLWRRLDLGGKTLKPGVVGRVILRGCVILRLAKAEVGTPIFSPQLQHLPTLLPVRSKLQYLDLSMAVIQPQALEELLSVCFDLKKLSLEHCTLTQSVCSYIAKNASLETLNLAMCYGLCHSYIVEILTQCKRLHCLNLAWTGLSSEDLRVICRRFPASLERLNLSGCRNTLSDSHVRLLSEQSSGLVELDVSDATQLTASAVSSIIKHLTRAEYLAFSRCYAIQPDTYLELKAMPNLLYLDLYGILNDSALNTLRQSLQHIKINKYLFSSVARPTVGIRRTSVWGLRVRD